MWLLTDVVMLDQTLLYKAKWTSRDTKVLLKVWHHTWSHARNLRWVQQYITHGKHTRSSLLETKPYDPDPVVSAYANCVVLYISSALPVSIANAIAPAASADADATACCVGDLFDAASLVDSGRAY